MRSVVTIMMICTMSALASATVVPGITDDFSGDLSQWKTLLFANPGNATITYATDTGRLKVQAVTSNTLEYTNKMLITNDSVAVTDGKLTMSTTLNVPTTSGTPKSYQGLRMTLNNTDGSTQEYIRRNAFEFQFTQNLADIWLTCFKSGEVADTQVRIASSSSSSLGWVIAAGHDYNVTMSLDQAANQLALTIVSLDGTPIVGGQSTVTTTMTYTTNVYEGSAYYAGYFETAKSTGTTQTETYYADNFVMGVPEPASIGILLVGGLACIIKRRK